MNDEIAFHAQLGRVELSVRRLRAGRPGLRAELVLLVELPGRLVGEPAAGERGCDGWE